MMLLSLVKLAMEQHGNDIDAIRQSFPSLALLSSAEVAALVAQAVAAEQPPEVKQKKAAVAANRKGDGSQIGKLFCSECLEHARFADTGAIFWEAEIIGPELYEIYLEWFATVDPNGKPLHRKVFPMRVVALMECRRYRPHGVTRFQGLRLTERGRFFRDVVLNKQKERDLCKSPS